MAQEPQLTRIDDLVDATRPIKAMLHRFAYLLLIAAAVSLIMIGKIETVLVERVRANFSDIVAPVLELISEPVRMTRSGAEHIVDLADLVRENERLREENIRLLQWRMVAKNMEGQIKTLKGLLNYDPGPSARFVSARALTDVGGAFARTALINVGTSKKVRPGQTVMTGEGVVGRIVHAGSRTARVLLLTDINARTPVMVGDPAVRAILIGDNSDNPKLKFIDGEDPLDPGALIVTSGHGGVFPANLPVGVVAGHRENETWAQTFVDWRRLDYVRVIDFGELPDPAAAEDEGESADEKLTAERLEATRDGG